jgi:hypothetical protein
LQIVRDIGRSNFAANDRLKGTPAEIKAAFEGMITHFGSYSIDESSKMLTFRMEGSSYPNWNDTKQPRLITALWQDDLTWTNPTPSAGTDKVTNAFRRIK